MGAGEHKATILSQKVIEYFWMMDVDVELVAAPCQECKLVDDHLAEVMGIASHRPERLPAAIASYAAEIMIEGIVRLARKKQTKRYNDVQHRIERRHLDIPQNEK